MKLRAALILAVALVASIAATPAGAAWTQPELVSVSPREQADEVTASVLSTDGRFLVFSGSIDAKAGILRRDLATGVIEPVAAGSAYEFTPIYFSGHPSVSADGRFVSFTTEAALDPADDHNEAPDVYVRDMEMSVPSDGASCAMSGPCAYTLVSAVDGGTEGLTYPDREGSASGRAAISADGSRVVFLVRSKTDLGAGAEEPGQIAIRDLTTERTTLVSSTRDPLTGKMTGEAVPGGVLGAGVGFWKPGFPVISADGSTVAWSSIDVAAQVATVSGDPARSSTEPYNEVLWRRIGEGEAAPTRRVVGAADPEAPGCPADGSMSEAACRGPYPFAPGNESSGFPPGWNQNGGSEPALSADGWTVATTGAPGPGHTHVTDLFLVDMHPGRARRESITRLTSGKDSSNAFETNSTGLIEEVALSPDGRRVALVTARREWLLPTPVVVTPPPQRLGSQELWLIDLGDDTLRRITTTVDGGPSNGGEFGAGGASSPSFADAGRLLAFDSTASNLIQVDKNEAADAFLSRDTLLPGGSPGRTEVSPPPAQRGLRAGWRLSLRAVSRPDGSVRIVADCPGAGRLRATAEATLSEARWVSVPGARGRRRVRRRVPVARRVAAGGQRVRAAGRDLMTLRPAPRLRGLSHRPGGLEATATVTFAARGHAKLHETLAIRFRVHGKGGR